LSPEVEFLRNFRDQTVLSTFAGSQFMTVFNQWYYSFSPYLAQFVASEPTVRFAVRLMLCPLLGILHVAAATQAILSFGQELSIVASGLVASSLIGIFYCAPWVTGILTMVKRRVRVSLRLAQLKPLITLWLLSIVSILIGEILASPLIMMFSTATFVLATLSLSALAVAIVMLWSYAKQSSEARRHLSS